MFFQTHKGSVTSFSILFNFQGPVRLGLSTGDLFILPPKWFFVKSFFQKLLNFSELGSLQTSQCQLVFFRVYWFLSRASCRATEVILLSGAWRSHIVPYPEGFGKCFFKVFLHFSLFVYKCQFFAVFYPVFDISLPYYNIQARTPAVLHRRGPELIQFFSSCFI